MPFLERESESESIIKVKGRAIHCPFCSSADCVTTGPWCGMVTVKERCWQCARLLYVVDPEYRPIITGFTCKGAENRFLCMDCAKAGGDGLHLVPRLRVSTETKQWDHFMRIREKDHEFSPALSCCLCHQCLAKTDGPYYLRSSTGACNVCTACADEHILSQPSRVLAIATAHVTDREMRICVELKILDALQSKSPDI